MTSEEKLIPINIEEEMKSSYIDYSMSVIVSRALPDVRDGLKPVHRRVLYGMHELGIRSNTAYKKSYNFCSIFFRFFVETKMYKMLNWCNFTSPTTSTTPQPSPTSQLIFLNFEPLPGLIFFSTAPVGDVRAKGTAVIEMQWREHRARGSSRGWSWHWECSSRGWCWH